METEVLKFNNVSKRRHLNINLLLKETYATEANIEKSVDKALNNDVCIYSLREVSMYLGFKDIRSVKRWCFNNGVRIHVFKGSKKRYIFSDDLDFLMNKSGTESNKLVLKQIPYKPQKYNEIESGFLSMLQSL